MIPEIKEIGSVIIKYVASAVKGSARVGQAVAVATLSTAEVLCEFVGSHC